MSDRTNLYRPRLQFIPIRFYSISMPTQDSPASISRLPPRPLSSPPSGRSFSRTSMIPALPSRHFQSECGRLSRISPNSESASDHNAIHPNQTVFQSMALLDVRGGRRKIEAGARGGNSRMEIMEGDCGGRSRSGGSLIRLKWLLPRPKKAMEL
jgi:hypothetical protein